MEQARLLLAIGLSFLVLFVWSMFFTDQQPVNNQNPEEQQSQISEKPTSVPPANSVAKAITETEIEDIQTVPAEVNPARQITVDTPIYSVRLSAKGAAFTSFVLRKYRESVDADSPNKELIPSAFKKGVIQTTLLGKSIGGLEDAVFSIEQQGDRLSVTDQKKRYLFQVGRR